MERGHIFNRWDNENVSNDYLHHRDNAKKEIGDRVLIIDFSSVTHLNGEPLDIDDPNMQFSTNYFIVIDNRLKVKYDAAPRDTFLSNYVINTFNSIYTQDLIIVNPRSKVQYRVNSGHVMLK